jgi:hypothetical protein
MLPLMRFRVCSLFRQLVMVDCLSWDRARPLGGKRRTVGLEGQRVWYGKPPPPRMYLCLCWLRTEGLTLANKYWTCWSHAGDMGPASLLVCRQHMLGLSLLLPWLCLETNWGGSHGPLSRAKRWSQEHFFLGAVVSIQRCWWLAKCCYTRTERGMSVACWSSFPCIVYIDSNHRDSRIWVPLVCGH